MPANRDNISMRWIDRSQAIAQAPDQGVKGLVGHVYGRFFPPNGNHQVLPGYNPAAAVLEDL